MRRVTTVLTVCYCAITGCVGGAAQEPYDGVVVSGRGSATLRVPAAPSEDTGPMASEVDLPWTIALLSDAEARLIERRETIEAEAVEVEPLVDEVRLDVQLAIDHALDEKPVPSKSCPGVVKGRS